MSKKSRFRWPSDKQHGKSAQALLKSASQHLYHIHWSQPSKLSWKKSLLLTWKILGLLVNTLAADEKYPVLNTDNLTIPIQMQLSQKKKTFSPFFTDFLTSNWNFGRLGKKYDCHSFCISEVTNSQNVVREMSKNSRLREPVDKQHRKFAQALLKSHHNTFIIFIDHS